MVCVEEIRKNIGKLRKLWIDSKLQLVQTFYPGFVHESCLNIWVEYLGTFNIKWKLLFKKWLSINLDG